MTSTSDTQEIAINCTVKLRKDAEGRFLPVASAEGKTVSVGTITLAPAEQAAVVASLGLEGARIFGTLTISLPSKVLPAEVYAKAVQRREAKAAYGNVKEEKVNRPMPAAAFG